MKLTESELRNMIYEEVINTLDKLDEGWGEDAWNKVKSVANKAGNKVRNVVNKASKSIAASNSHQNSPIQQAVVDTVYGKRQEKQEQKKQLANGGASSQQQQAQTNQQQAATNNRDIAQSKTGQKQQ